MADVGREASDEEPRGARGDHGSPAVRPRGEVSESAAQPDAAEWARTRARRGERDHVMGSSQVVAETLRADDRVNLHEVSLVHGGLRRAGSRCRVDSPARKDINLHQPRAAIDRGPRAPKTRSM